MNKLVHVLTFCVEMNLKSLAIQSVEQLASITQEPVTCVESSIKSSLLLSKLFAEFDSGGQRQFIRTSVEVTENFASSVLSDSFLMIHDSIRSGQNNEPKVS